jgi:hypothetical protein
MSIPTFELDRSPAVFIATLEVDIPGTFDSFALRGCVSLMVGMGCPIGIIFSFGHIVWSWW